MVNNYWAQQAARQLQKKQEELKQVGTLTPVRDSRKPKPATTSNNRRTRYFTSSRQGGCGCGK